MSPLLRHLLHAVREFLLAASPFVLIGAVLLWSAYLLLDPTPPKRVVLKGGAGMVQELTAIVVRHTPPSPGTVSADSGEACMPGVGY